MKNGNKLIFECVNEFNHEQFKKEPRCQIRGPKCTVKVTRAVIVNSHPCAGKINICSASDCYAKSTQKLTNEYKKSKHKEEKSRNHNHRH